MLHHGSSAAPASWWTYWITERARRAASGDRPLTGRPSSRISPAVSRCRPRMVRPRWSCRSPIRPPAPRISPSRKSRLTFLTARTGGTVLRKKPLLPPSSTERSRPRKDAGRSCVLHAAHFGAGCARPALRRRAGAADRATSRAARREAAARRRPSGDGTEPGMPMNDVGAVGMAGEQRARVGMRRRVEDRRHRTRLDRLAGIDHAEIVAQFRHDAEIVGHEQDRDAEFAQPARAAAAGSDAGS